MPKAREGQRATARNRRRRADAAARRAAAIPLLVAGWPYARIAAELGISTRTLERYVATDPRIAEALEHAQRETSIVIATHRRRLEALVTTAIIALADAADEGDVAAARAILQYAGMAPPRQLEHSGPGGSALNIAAPGMQRALERVWQQRARAAALEHRLRELGEDPNDIAPAQNDSTDRTKNDGEER